ncbi:hypothetical protein GCM10020295_16170 [Streptomyces cinereospinus]
MQAGSAGPPPELGAAEVQRFRFSPPVARAADEVLADGPVRVYRRLLADQESETGALVALRLLDAVHGPDHDGHDAARGPDHDGHDAARGPDHDVIDTARGPDHDVIDAARGPGGDVTTASVTALVAAAREASAPVVRRLTAGPPERIRTVLRHRAPLALLSGCWLDNLSSPATQPDALVNQLFVHRFRLKGEGRPEHGCEQRRRRALERYDLHLPPLNSDAFLTGTDCRPLTAWHGAYLLALSRLPAAHLPEVVGVHVAHYLLGVDGLLLGHPEPLTETMLTEVLDACVARTHTAPHGAADRRRLLAAVRRYLDIEAENLALLTAHAEHESGLSPDARAARVLLRHAPYAGAQHRRLRLAGRPLSAALDEGLSDPATLLARLRESPYLRRRPDGGCAFLDALKFGGAMFGVFDEQEAATLRSWVASVQDGAPAGPAAVADPGGAAAAGRWAAAVTRGPSPRETSAGPDAPDDRTLLHRLVDVEHHAAVLPLARARCEETLAAAEVLFEHGARGRFTDASYFDYTPQRLVRRVESVYWDKLVRTLRAAGRDTHQGAGGHRAQAVGAVPPGGRRLGVPDRQHRTVRPDLAGHAVRHLRRRDGARRAAQEPHRADPPGPGRHGGRRAAPGLPGLPRPA